MDVRQFWDINDLDKTRQNFEALLKDAMANDQQETVACALTQLARIDNKQNRFSQAQEKLASAVKLAPKDAIAPSVHIALEQGRLYRNQGDINAAKKSFQYAFATARDAKNLDYLMIDALHMLAMDEKPQAALKLVEQAQELVKHGSAQARAWLGPLMNNLAWTFFDAGQYDDAISCFERDTAIRLELGAIDERKIADWNRAHVMRIAGKHDEALAVLKMLETEAGENGFGIAFVYEELAELAELKNDARKASDYAAKSLSAHNAVGELEKNEPEKFKRLTALANFA